MITTSELAGFFAAHAMWCVSDGATLTPILAHTTGHDERTMERLGHGDLETAVQIGKRKLESNEMEASDAVFLYDGWITVGGQRLDAIIIEMRAYFSPDSEVVMAVPYTPTAAGQFRVHKPKLLAWNGCEDFDQTSALEAFFQGVAAHEKGSEIWNKCLDESK